MDCKQLHTYLDAGHLETWPAGVREHLSGCPACGRTWALMREAREILRMLPEPPVPPGFADRILESTRPSADRRTRRTRIIWPLAIAATLLLGIGIGITLHWGATNPAAYQLQNGIVMLPANTVTRVRIALDTAHPLHDVGFLVNVPQGVHLQGHPREQQVAWRGELAQGRNILNLQLLAKAGAKGTLETILHYDGRDNVFKVRVVAVKDASFRGLVHRLLAHMRLG